MQIKFNFKSKYFLAFLVIILLFIGSFIFGYLNLEDKEELSSESEEELNPVSSFDTFPLDSLEKEEYFNVLLLGYGGEAHAGGALSDSIIVVHVNFKKKVVGLISVPRDLWVSLPSDSGKQVGKKVNSAFALDGGGLAKDTVGKVIGMPIEYYIAVDFKGIEEAIDNLGGVKVDVPVAFDDYWYPIKGQENDPCGKTEEEIAQIVETMSGFEGEKQFPCRYEHLHFDKGLTEMNGETALKFTRSRHSAEHGGDFARSQRQFALLQGIRSKLISLGALDDIIPFFNKLKNSLTTNFDEKSVLETAKLAGKESDYLYSNIQLTEQNVLVSGRRGGQFVLLPKLGEENWRGVQGYIASELEKNETGEQR